MYCELEIRYDVGCMAGADGVYSIAEYRTVVENTVARKLT